MTQAAAAASAEAARTAPLVVGRYALFDEIAAGGMATVHLGRLLGPVGFGRTVAVKRLHAHYLKDQEFITMFMDEARIVARIRHPNVVPMVDVVQGDEGLFLVMEYVHGESLSRLMRTARKNGEAIPPRIASSIMCGVLLGLHAAHDTKGLDGQLLGVVHRDVSPQNVIVGADGAARVLDFGIAKAAGRAQVTREGQIKGKLAYMAPEQIRGQVDRRTDVFAAGVVLWEMLAGRRLHEGSKDVDIITRVVQGNFSPPSAFAPGIPPELDDVVLRALATDPKKRVASARDLALELERTVGLASPSEVSEWVERLACEVLQARANLVGAMELAAGDLVPIETKPPPGLQSSPMHPIATPFVIPVHLDPTHQVQGEIPSSSAVFAHAQTAGDVSVMASATRRMDARSWVVVAVSCALAVIGVALGAYALVRRSAQPARPGAAPSAALSALPRATAPSTGGTAPPASANTASGGSAASGAPSSAASGSSTTDGGDDKAATRRALPVASTTAGASTTAATTATAPATGFATTTATAPVTATARPAAVLPAPGGATVRKPTPKPSCDPAYTLDEVGHRHYKPECMGGAD